MRAGRNHAVVGRFLLQNSHITSVNSGKNPVVLRVEIARHDHFLKPHLDARAMRVNIS
jgi:hypothetical protein